MRATAGRPGRLAWHGCQATKPQSFPWQITPPYRLVRRTRMDGKKCHRYRVWDPVTMKRREFFPGKTNRDAAEGFCEDRLVRGCLVPPRPWFVPRLKLFQRFRPLAFSLESSPNGGGGQTVPTPVPKLSAGSSSSHPTVPCVAFDSERTSCLPLPRFFWGRSPPRGPRIGVGPSRRALGSVTRRLRRCRRCLRKQSDSDTSARILAPGLNPSWKHRRFTNLSSRGAVPEAFS